MNAAERIAALKTQDPEQVIRPKSLVRMLALGIYQRHALIAWLAGNVPMLERPQHDGDMLGASLQGVAGAYRLGDVVAALEKSDELPGWITSVWNPFLPTPSG